MNFNYSREEYRHIIKELTWYMNRILIYFSIPMFIFGIFLVITASIYDDLRNVMQGVSFIFMGLFLIIIYGIRYYRISVSMTDFFNSFATENALHYTFYVEDGMYKVANLDSKTIVSFNATNIKYQLNSKTHIYKYRWWIYDNTAKYR